MIAAPEQVVRQAALTLLRGVRLDTGQLATELGISRVTLFRRVGNREAILSEALWLLARRAIEGAERHHDEGVASGRLEPSARLRCLSVMEQFRREVAGAAALRTLLDEEPVVAMRLLTDPVGRVQPRVVDAMVALVQRDVEEHGLQPTVPLSVLCFALVRLSEAFLYSDVLAQRDVDLGAATTVVDAMMLSVLQPAD